MTSPIPLRPNMETPSEKAIRELQDGAIRQKKAAANVVDFTLVDFEKLAGQIEAVSEIKAVPEVVRNRLGTLARQAQTDIQAIRLLMERNG